MSRTVNENNMTNSLLNGSKAWTFVGQILMALIIPLLGYQVWVTNSLFDLREWRSMSMKINADQDRHIYQMDDKLPPATFVTQFNELRADVKSLEIQVAELNGLLRQRGYIKGKRDTGD